MEFKYIHGGPISTAEEKVVNLGYAWVRTNELQPTRTAGSSDKGALSNLPDRLRPHSHHGWNTHLIVAGDLRIVEQPTRGRSRARTERKEVELSMEPGAKKEGGFGPGIAYSGTTRHGCRFVEGQRRLSPASAERFLARGTLVAVKSNDSKDGDGYELPDTDTLCRWLRDAQFTPPLSASWWQRWGWGAAEEGKRQEVLMFHDIPTNEAQGRAQRAIERWFENEWKGFEKDREPRRHTCVAAKNILIVLSCLVALIIGWAFGPAS